MATMSVYVGRLHENTKKKVLEREFSHFGRITKVWVARNPPGFAFINFENDDDARRAIKQMNGVRINGSKIRVASCGGNRECRKQKGVYNRDHYDRRRLDYRFDSDFRHGERAFMQGCRRYRNDGYYKGSKYRNRSPINQRHDSVNLMKSRSSLKKKDDVEDSMDSTCYINLLPEEMLIKIFSHLTQNELGRVSRVCRGWEKCARSPILWKKVDVKFSWRQGSQNKIVSIFAKKLSSSVTYMKLDFDFCSWKGKLNFEKFCITLSEICPNLHTLILNHASFQVNFPSVIDLCNKLLPNLKALMLPMSLFDTYERKCQYDNLSKMEVLDVSQCWNAGKPSMYSFSKMPCLKKINLFGTQAVGRWFNMNEVAFLHQIEVLHLGSTSFYFGKFNVLKNHAVNLTEVFLCGIELYSAENFNFNNTVFPVLKTICLRNSDFVTCEGIVSLVQSCLSLQNAYVEKKKAKSYARHPFVIANTSKLQIVKRIDNCDHKASFFA